MDDGHGLVVSQLEPVGQQHIRDESSNVRCMDRRSEQDRAADKLRHWEDGSRDDAVREAAAVGLSLTYIHEITGLGKTTIMRILNDRLRRGARS